MEIIMILKRRDITKGFLMLWQWQFYIWRINYIVLQWIDLVLDFNLVWFCVVGNLLGVISGLSAFFAGKSSNLLAESSVVVFESHMTSCLLELSQCGDDQYAD